jgi:SAM-dependent methyltransferase
MSLRTEFFAATYDRQMRRVEGAGLTAMAAKPVSQATGRVLEIGGGTGANLARYRPVVTSLTIIEPDTSMLTRLERRVSAQVPAGRGPPCPGRGPSLRGRRLRRGRLNPRALRCRRPTRAVRELRRVLRSGGRFLFLKHLRASDPPVAKKQDRMSWMNRAVVCCDCSRPTLDTIEHAGFNVADIEHTELPKTPSFVRPAVVGIAIPSAASGQAAKPDQSVETPL